MNLRRIRGFLQLTQRDVEMAAGVPTYRLAKAEHGLLRLNVAEQGALEAYYKARLKMAMEDECEFTNLLHGEN